MPATKTKTKKTAKESDNKLKIAIVSINMSCIKHIKEISTNENVEIVAVVDNQIEKAENFIIQNKLKNAKIYRNEKELISKEKLHAVFDFKDESKILSSISKFLEKGIDVIIDQPEDKEIDDLIKSFTQKTSCEFIYRKKLVQFENKGKIYYML